MILNRFIGLAATALSLFSFDGTAAAAPDTTCKAPLEARYAAMNRAMDAHDAAGMRAILAPGFASVDAMGGRVDAGQMVTEVMAQHTDVHKTSAMTVLSCSGSEKGLTVKQRFYMKTVRQGPDGAPHKIELVTLSTDLWVKPGPVWLIERTVTDEMTLYRDGKLAGHRTHPSM